VSVFVYVWLFLLWPLFFHSGFQPHGDVAGLYNTRKTEMGTQQLFFIKSEGVRGCTKNHMGESERGACMINYNKECL